MVSGFNRLLSFHGKQIRRPALGQTTKPKGQMMGTLVRAEKIRRGRRSRGIIGIRNEIEVNAKKLSSSQG
jgi:hypothetical protein